MRSGRAVEEQVATNLGWLQILGGPGAQPAPLRPRVLRPGLAKDSSLAPVRVLALRQKGVGAEIALVQQSEERSCEPDPKPGVHAR